MRADDVGDVITTEDDRACDRLHCTGCDLKVLTFDDMRWDFGTDYLFLRNNYPAVGGKLVPSSGSRAYGCQCSHRSVRGLQAQKEKSLKWVCGMH
ncbi:unnamed protein product [Darwinula stevensoni]|uniref:Cilia- and flagella-associated protein 418 n=1 Tax=Darwinula stevensoni TaxID=69355 RepID=A0A7R8XAC6_9CRUS|nr:unnamed protein product [Darwinula stevensoni]CAG0891802.1 unnamed protein product [Darwinula stevensoni]